MSAYFALGPASVAVFTALNVSSLTSSLAPGGVHEVLPQGVTYPAVLFSLAEGRQLGGLGTKPGSGQLPEIELRVHVFDDYHGLKRCQAAMSEVVRLVTAGPLTVSGYRFCGGETFYDDALPLRDEVVAGERVQELVANFRFYVEQGS